MSDHDRVLVALQPILAERADDFDDWLRVVLVPAIRTHRPHLEGRWEILRAEGQEDGLVRFAFILRGQEEHDWEMLPLLTQALGRERAEQALAEMGDMTRGVQSAWFFRPVEAAHQGER